MPAHGRVRRGKDLAGLPLLLVSDDPELRDFVELNLSRLELSVELRASGALSVDELSARPMAALLLDDCAPVATLAATLRALRGELSTQQLPIVAFLRPQGALLASSRDLLLRAGADDCVEKPLDPGVLERVLARHGLLDALSLDE